MNFMIHKISYYIEPLLKSSHSGMIHSIYRKTINLNINGRIVALQADGSPLSPLSLITTLSSSDIEELKLARGDRVTLSENQINIHSSLAVYHASYNDADRYDLLLSCSLDAKGCKELTQNIRSVLSQTNTGGFDMFFNDRPDTELSLILLAAKKHISDSFHLYKDKKYHEAGKVLLKVLGLGTGLTPSGDDFLCGVLAGLRLCGREKEPFAETLKLEIAAHLSDTIDISAAFLSCALENQYSLAVNSLAHIPKPVEIASSFSEIGHSSGMDTLCGVFYALNI